MEDAKSTHKMPSPDPPPTILPLAEANLALDTSGQVNFDKMMEQDDTIDRILLQYQIPDGAASSTQHDEDQSRKDEEKVEASTAEDGAFSFHVAPYDALSLQDNKISPLDRIWTATQIPTENMVQVTAAEHSNKADEAEETSVRFDKLTMDSTSDKKSTEGDVHWIDSSHPKTDSMEETSLRFDTFTMDSASDKKDTEGDVHWIDSLNLKAPPEGTVQVVDSTSSHTHTVDERGLIDTAAPFESVKEAVSKFGGILDWKAHKIQAVERRKFVEEELEKALEEIPEYKRHSERAEDEKLRVLMDLDSTKRLIEELKLNVERAQTEDYQARQDAELARLRMEEIEQGIEDEASFATKAQLEVAKARHAAASSELSTVREELDALHKEYISLVEEKILATEKAEEASAASREAERMVEELSIELIAAKESLESSQASHLEAEEQRIGAAMAKEKECLNWEKELRQVEEELCKLNEQVEPVKELKSKLETASALLNDLKAELVNYMESAFKQEDDKENGSNGDAQVSSLEKELEMLKSNLEKTTAEVNYLKVAAALLETELETERMAISVVKEREEMASLAVESLKAELDRTKSEITLLQEKEYENQAKMIMLPMQLPQAAQEVDCGNSLTEHAHQGLSQAKEEAERAKAGANAMQSQLEAALKEIEAAKASERLALEAIKALQESESAEITSDADSSPRIKLSLEEYYELSRRAREAEEQANMRVVEAVSQIEVAKESEMQCLEKLEQVNQEKAKRKEELLYAMERAEKSQASKLAVEQELRRWRAEHEQKRKDGGSNHGAENSDGITRGFEETKESSNFISIPDRPASYPASMSSETESPPEVKPKKKKKSFFPRILLFLARRKAHHRNS